MSTNGSTEIHSGHELVGFWQFTQGSGHYFGVLERDVEVPQSVLSFGRIEDDGRVLAGRRIENEDTSIHAADARVVGNDMVFALEKNRVKALQIVRAPVASLIDPSAPPVAFEVLHDVDLSAARVAKVALPVAELWNVADSLAPVRWLFSPRFARGSDAAELTVNSADGRAVGFASNGTETAVDVADAALPQMLIGNGHRWLAFERFEAPCYPFWVLARYSGPAQPAAGALWIAEDAGPAHDLSIGLKLGPVIGFSIAAGRDGNPWIFALRRAATGVTLTVLTRRGIDWAIVQDWPVEGPAERVSALWDRQAWHIVYSTRTSDGESLRYMRRP